MPTCWPAGPPRGGNGDKQVRPPKRSPGGKCPLPPMSLLLICAHTAILALEPLPHTGILVSLVVTALRAPKSGGAQAGGDGGARQSANVLLLSPFSPFTVCARSRFEGPFPLSSCASLSCAWVKGDERDGEMLRCQEMLKNESRRCSFPPPPSCALTSPPDVGACGETGERAAVPVFFALQRLFCCLL